ncbi:tRNA lysidine(34) synthetase TilS [Gilvimarinus agarilyticus]|uniref:tRNA lysidine(34) synthetase TilS n=1 Tax=Gilvimarinus sp. 2_MG-2023 TaxID=3062666 RepID=UPI001C0866A1|nr:tRNA lysidine(34) synthetase TilS [Gilvimarinus sp. 2_MG-2023]MBU2886139.1 tRNA lysidine(34) synthetase TilS [Gilvimarinus agarilyticus]MDO6570849.1 tRNA lysidine(34) synthetase TilS [Gilvimarinus sp. 2_MG-2023]
MTDEIQQRLQQVLHSQPSRRWLVGFSGGLDSTVLLHALQSQVGGQAVMAVHVNHGLSANADTWQAHCQAQCQSLGVHWVVEKVQLTGSGAIEERARNARLAVFAKLMDPGDGLLLAHHRQDQAETVLFRLLRGAGVTGLGAMRWSRPFAAGHIKRPLLGVDRAALQAYAERHKLSWVEDESNTDTTFDRNYLRRTILPALRKRWPLADQNLALAAQHCQEADLLLQELAQLDLSTLAERQEPMGVSVALEPLLGLSESRRRNLLRHWLRSRLGETVGAQLLADIQSQLLCGQNGHAQVGNKNLLLGCFQQRLYALSAPLQWQPSAQVAAPEPTIAWQQPEQVLLLPGGDYLQWVDAQADTSRALWGRALARKHMGRNIVVDWRRGGERCRPAGRGHSQGLKKLLQEQPLPIWLRARVPLIYIDNELAAVGDLWVCEAFAAAADEPAANLKWEFPCVTLDAV